MMRCFDIYLFYPPFSIHQRDMLSRTGLLGVLDAHCFFFQSISNRSLQPMKFKKKESDNNFSGFFFPDKS